MVPNRGEHFYSDDDLDDLPNDYLAELEHNAIQFTQAHTQPRTLNAGADLKVAPSSDYGDDIDDEDLDDAVVIDESRSTPVAIPNLQRDVPNQAVQREQFRQHLYGSGTVGNPHATGLDNGKARMPPPPMFSQPIPSGSRARTTADDPKDLEHGSQPSVADPGVDALQKQIQELLQERDALKSDLNAKTGEIAIVRSKQEQTVKQYEREMIAIRKLNEEKVSKQEKALEAAKIAEKNAATERDFFKQDLAEESERVRRLNKAKAMEKQGANLTTPKKKKALAHRDGFDDEEIELLSPSKISPSKFQKRLMGSPSKAGGKRKRKTVESPAAALDLEVMQDEPVTEQVEPREMILDETIIASLSVRDDRFDFLGMMLDHKVDSKHKRTIQELENYALPSSPDDSLQTHLLSKIPELGLIKSQIELPVNFCELVISLWSKCMEEKYYGPIYLLVDMLALALELKTSAIAPSLTDSIVPLAQLTADLVVIPRWKGQSAELHEKHIDVAACLAILHIIALGCMSEQQRVIRFWKLMRFDFVLVMLSPNQPTADFEMMMRLLSTSVFDDSFGAIVVESTQAVQVMDNILDRLTYTLFEVPPLPQSSTKMDLAMLSKLRLKVLLLMTSMTRSPFASKAMAMHPHAIGRLVSLISDELDDLYDYRSRHKESSRIISLAMRLLYHLVTKYDDDIDMQKKLTVIHGGSQKYLLALSRLNFSEDDLLLESSIDPDVAACALELLELVVTPEEGDAIHSAFSVGS